MMEVELTTVVYRPVATVWDFYAVHSVENHPRWDADIKPERISEGTNRVRDCPPASEYVLRSADRRDSRDSGFEAERVMGAKIRDGDIKTSGRATFVVLSPDRTAMTLWWEFSGMDDSMVGKSSL